MKEGRVGREKLTIARKPVYVQSFSESPPLVMVGNAPPLVTNRAPACKGHEWKKRTDEEGRKEGRRKGGR